MPKQLTLVFRGECLGLEPVSQESENDPGLTSLPDKLALDFSERNGHFR